jgi:hypothetical protein
MRLLWRSIHIGTLDLIRFTFSTDSDWAQSLRVAVALHQDTLAVSAAICANTVRYQFNLPAYNAPIVLWGSWNLTVCDDNASIRPNKMPASGEFFAAARNESKPK